MVQIQKGDVIVANENAEEWAGCLLFVDEAKSWGVQAGMVIPKQGEAYIRLKHDQYEYIGSLPCRVSEELFDEA